MEGKFVDVPVKKEFDAAQLQFQLEEDVNIPEMKPDLEVPVAEKWNVITRHIKVGNGKVCVDGEVEYLILYAVENGSGRLEVLNGSFPFNQCLFMDGAENDDVDAQVLVSGAQVRKRNNRKLSILLTLEMEAKKVGRHNLSMMEDIDENVEKKFEGLKVLKLCHMGKEVVHFKEVLSLASNRPDIGRILYHNIQLRGMEIQPQDGKLMIKGEASLFVIYESGEEMSRIQYVEINVPLEQALDCDKCEEDQLLEYTFVLEKEELTASINEDGEERDLSMHIEMRLCYELKENEELQYLADAYSLKEQLVLTREDMQVEALRRKSAIRLRLNEIFLPPLEDKLLQIFPMKAELNFSKPEVVNDGVLLEGVLQVSVMYFSANPTSPPTVAKIQIPFHQMMEDIGISKNVRVSATGDLAQLTTTILDSRQAEIKASVNVTMVVYETTICKGVVSLKSEPYGKRNATLPGMVGYVIGPEDTLWDLAKDNATTMDEIRELNPFIGQDVRQGEKIVICRNL